MLWAELWAAVAEVATGKCTDFWPHAGATFEGWLCSQLNDLFTWGMEHEMLQCTMAVLHSNSEWTNHLQILQS